MDKLSPYSLSVMEFKNATDVVRRMDAAPSPRPRFVKEDGQEKFYVRTGNASNALSLMEMFAYFAQRWPGALAGVPGK